MVEDASSGTTTTETTTAQPAQKAASAPAPQSTVPVYTPSVATTNGAISDKFMEVLLGALEQNNQPGFDYLEFRQALKNLAKMPMDEATRYQSAYAMAQTMGVTSEKLLDSAKSYLNVLVNEQSKFNEAHAQQRARLIGNREEEVKSIEAMIQQKSEQIKNMTQQIEEHRTRSEQIRKEVSDSTIKIENTKADFDVTFNSVMAQIKEDAAKMQQHIK